MEHLFTAQFIAFYQSLIAESQTTGAALRGIIAARGCTCPSKLTRNRSFFKRIHKKVSGTREFGAITNEELIEFLMVIALSS